ncbi:MAG: hypothetical protein COA95_04495 [Methylophaga sp.]|nr:MAG: hypothetical protein COA95_04495 [Methylophaga sp.]
MRDALADWSANFQAPSHAQSTLLIELPDDLDILTLTTLAVELDGIDITSLLSFDNNKDFSYTPIKPLQNGEHVLRLVILNADGSSVEKSQWSFNIVNAQASNDDATADQQQIAAAESWLRSASFEADTLTEFSNRIAQNNISNLPDHSVISGGGNVRGVIKGEKLTVDMQANYFIQSEKNLSLNGNRADIGEYGITVNYAGETTTSGFTLGHHDIGLDSMLFSSFQRRGASARIANNSGRISANVFAFRPESQVGASDFTGLSDSNNRLEGASMTFQPFSGENDALKMTALYYDGEGATGGIGIGGEEETATGSGWGVILEKDLADGRVNVRGEYARSQYDADGHAGLAPEDDSNAISLLIESRPFDNPILFGNGADIIIGAKYERVDTFFESLANQGLAADRDAITAYTNLYWGSLSANLQLSNETNNVDDLASSPTDQLQNILWNTNYSFDPQTGSRQWLGTPYLNLSGFISTLDRKDTPLNYEGNDTDNTSTSITLGGGSSYQHWYWSASHSYATLEDHADTTSDTVSHFSSLGAGWTVSDRLELNSDMQYGLFKDKDNHATSYSTNMNFGLRSILIKNKLNLSFNYNLNLPAGSDDSPDKHIVNSELGWTIRSASKNHPGLSLAIRGSMEKTNGNSNSTSDETQYQIFAIFQVMAPLSTSH